MATEPPRRLSEPLIERYMGGIDRTLLRENLRRSPEERLLQLQELSRFADELRRAGRAARQRDAR